MAGFRIVVNAATDDLVGNALSDYFESKLGPRIQANAKRTVPVDLGNLKRSIIVQVQRGDQPVLQVGVDPHAPGITIPEVEYGRYVEQGTSKMAAQPYLRPAVYQARGRVV
jgi:HK97 gp10 family phage protein